MRTGTATLTNVSIGSLHAGSAAISVTFAADDLDLAATATATLSIAKAPLTITAVSKSKVYGAALPALTASYLGFVNGDGGQPDDPAATRHHGHRGQPRRGQSLRRSRPAARSIPTTRLAMSPEVSR